jgi:hypothetical protein
LRILCEEALTATGRKTERTFVETVLREKNRSERYNHYFSVVLLSSLKLSAWKLLERAARSLRSTDMYTVLDSRGGCRFFSLSGPPAEADASAAPTPGSPSVGIVLPETDREGARAALKRLEGMVTEDEAVRMGVAVYPEDSTDVGELLATAAEWA